MVVPENDPLGPFLNSIEAAFSPIGSNFRKAASRFEHCFNGVMKNGDGTKVEQVVGQLDVKNSRRSVDINFDDRQKGKLPIKMFPGTFAENCAISDGNHNFECARDEKLTVIPSKYGVNGDANCLRLDLALSFVIGGFVRAFLSPFKPEKMGPQSISKISVNCNDSHLRVEKEDRVLGGTKQQKLKVKEGKDLAFEHLMTFVLDQLSNFSKCDVVVKDHECRDTDYEASRRPVYHFDHFKVLSSILDGKRAGMNGFFGNSAFARVGGVPSSSLGAISMKNVGEECNTNNENRGGDSDSIDELLGRSIGSENATVTVTVPPPVEITTDSVLKSAFAGGIACSFSTFLMHPVDTVKTQVQASTLSFTEILAELPQLGVRGLYMGSIPAIVGQFLSHGLRTGICETSKVVLINAAPSLPEIQVQSMASFFGTFLGTVMRIPCEVLKQRLQAGQFNHVGEALVGTWQQDGLGGFFRGTGMTLCRELPFYVFGTGLYTESKKAVQKILGRELEPWETIAVGAISGGLTAVSTTPFDVIKTRMMTALQGQPTTMSIVALSILRDEGLIGLFRGAVPRFFWVAPLGAINFAGYELIRKAMD